MNPEDEPELVLLTAVYLLPAQGLQGKGTRYITGGRREKEGEERRGPAGNKGEGGQERGGNRASYQREQCGLSPTPPENCSNQLVGLPRWH